MIFLSPARDRPASSAPADLHRVDDMFPHPDRAAGAPGGAAAGPGSAQELGLVEGQEMGAAYSEPALQQVRHLAVSW
jgi:hypothetical protein